MRSPSFPPLAAAEFLSAKPFSPRDLTEQVSGTALGAVVSFEGTIRGEEEGRSILSITYEAYDAMAEKEIGKIIAEAERRWPVKALVRHRTGRVRVGEAAVAVACAGGHREEAFAACRYLIDSVKSRAPIWKVGFQWR